MWKGQRNENNKNEENRNESEQHFFSFLSPSLTYHYGPRINETEL